MATAGKIVAVDLALRGVSDLLQSAAISRRNKTHIQQDLDDVRRRYKEAIKSLTDPTATPEQSAQLAQRAIDNANWASRRIDELIPNGGYAARSMQDTLTGIVEEMKPYTSGDVLLAPQYRPVPRIPQVSGFAEFKAMQNTGLQRMPTFDKFIAMRYGDTEEYRKR